jgi:hypothetical protein
VGVVTAAVRNAQRWTRSRPCPICDGTGDARRGSSRRCHGYLSSDGLYAHCSRAESAGPLDPHGRTGLYPHRTSGPCRCGVTHGHEQMPLETDTAAIEQRAREIAAEEAKRAELLAKMPATWAALDQRSIAGESYLRSRALDPAALRHVVRFSPRGEPALCERSLETGVVTGVQYRRLDGPQKIVSEFGSVAKGAALHGRLAELDREGVDAAVICEGVIDTLTAIVAFPGCAIFGAPGCAHLRSIAAAVAARVREIGGWLLVVPDDDPDGVTAAAGAVKAAIAAGLVLHRDLHVVDLGDAHDLSDAWGSGWRWQWPSESGGAA